MADHTEIEAALAANHAGQVVTIGQSPNLVVPAGYQLLNFEKQLAAPTRITGRTELKDVKSFIALFNEFKGPAAKLYGTIEPAKFVGVLNDDSAANGPGWGDHTVTYTCPHTTEWRTWIGANKKPMNQVDFAQFIEDNLPDIVDGALLLEVSRTLEAKKKVNFASGIRLSDGQNQFTYEEQIEGTAGKGQFKVPETFGLGLSVFEGGEKYAVEARLRYRINEGKLALWYDLTRPHKIVEDAVKGVWAEIEAGTETTILHAAV